MKLASVMDGTPDGRLVILSQDGESYCMASYKTFQEFARSGALPETLGRPQSCDQARFDAILPRASGFLDGSAYVNHVALVRQARGADMPARFWTDPLMYQGCADPMLPPGADIPSRPDWGTDFEAEIAVITGFVPMGCPAHKAADHIVAVTLLNDISLRSLIPDELAKGFGFVQSKPPSALAPFAVATGALPGWDGRKLHATVCVDLNGAAFGRVNSGQDMTFDFSQLIAHAARTRPLPAGTIIGSGTVSNRDADGGPGRTVAAGGRGYTCIAEQRMVETITTGAALTPFLGHGDHVRIWVEHDGQSLFGDISQTVSEDWI